MEEILPNIKILTYFATSLDITQFRITALITQAQICWIRFFLGNCTKVIFLLNPVEDSGAESISFSSSSRTFLEQWSNFAISRGSQYYCQRRSLFYSFLVTFLVDTSKVRQ
ncbi:hypothetical protein CHS0354_042425, partial [Potamilus streckersoni]